MMISGDFFFIYLFFTCTDISACVSLTYLIGILVLSVFELVLQLFFFPFLQIHKFLYTQSTFIW